MVSAILEATLIIIVLGLILAHSDAFSTSIKAVGSVYQSSVQTLAGVAG